MEKVSVIIPVYNVQEYLEECLRSVTGQTYQNMEIICVDDGSADRSLDILEAFARRDERIVIYRETVNRGQSHARNVGLEKASGTYVLFVDADDYIDKKLLEITVAGMECGNQTQQVDMVCFDYTEQDELWNGADKHRFFTESGICKAGMFFTEAVNRNCVINSPWSRLYLREFLIREQIRFIDGIIYEDLVHYLECMVRADYVYCIPDRLYTYRVRGSSTMTGALSGKTVTDYFQVLCHIVRIYMEAGLETELAEAVETYIAHVYWWFENACYQYARKDDINLLKNKFRENKSAKLYSLYTKIASGAGEVRNLTREQIRCLRESRHIVVYGAGKIARDVISILDRYDIGIDGIAVSSLDGNPGSISGNRVRQMEAYMKYQTDSIVVIATAARFYPEIENKLGRLGFFHYIKPLDR